VRLAVVLAGGLGTRVAHLTGRDTPKAMLPIDGRPFIDYKLLQLASIGFTHALLLTGHAAPLLRKHVGDGSRYGLTIEWAHDGPQPLGTGAAVVAVLDRLPATFWLTYGDSLVEAPVQDVEETLKGALLGVMTVIENDDHRALGNVDIDAGIVVRYEKGKPAGSFRWIDHGLLLFRRRAFFDQPAAPFDVGEVVRRPAMARRLGAFVVSEPFHDIGSEPAWRETDGWARRTNLWARLQEAPEQPPR
jgi:NDP-sugar pyrophosphorylase family protein